MAVTVEIDDREVLEALDRLKQSMGNLKPVMDKVGGTLVSLIHQQLGRGVTPWGEPMEPLKYRKGVPLNNTRMHIYQRITHQTSADSVRVGMLDSASAMIGLVHQYGSTRLHAARQQTLYFKVNAKSGKSRFAKKGKANFAQDVTIPEHTSIIPARPFMPIRDDQADLPQEWMAAVLEDVSKVMPD